MQSNSTVAAEPQGGHGAIAPRSRKTSDPLFGINGNTRRGRRVRDLARAFLRRLGDRAADPLWQAAAVEAAELVTIAEEARARAGSGVATIADLDALVRIQGVADRAVRKLGRAVIAKPPTLAEYIASRKAAAAQTPALPTEPSAEAL